MNNREPWPLSPRLPPSSTPSSPAVRVLNTGLLSPSSLSCCLVRACATHTHNVSDLPTFTVPFPQIQVPRWLLSINMASKDTVHSCSCILPQDPQDPQDLCSPPTVSQSFLHLYLPSYLKPEIQSHPQYLFFSFLPQMQTTTFQSPTLSSELGLWLSGKTCA